MTLPAPNLDDRRFQDLVDEAKRLVQQRCPEWSDHNVSDPGVTLIEVFAWMTDQLLYRLNRVPDRNYIKFLELIGVRLFPPAASTADVTFWLSAPQPDVVRIPRGTEVATVRTETDDAIPFETIEELSIVPASLTRVASSIRQGAIRDHWDALQSEEGFYCFNRTPKPGDVLLFGLSTPVPSCAAAIRLECEIEGVGVDPRRPPLVWEAWTGDGWTLCEVDRDETGGLNRAGDIVIHVPKGHTVSIIENRRAGWIRCRVVAAEEGQPAYSASPKIISATAFTIGGTARSANVEIIDGEIIGTSEGVAGQHFQLLRRPVVKGDVPEVLEVLGNDKPEDWQRVDHFAESNSHDRHFVIDEMAGEVVLGPAVRDEAGAIRQFGAIPPKGATLRMRTYRSGGGRRGNVAAKSIRVLRSSIPYVSSVENRRDARGGVDGEDIENAKARAPLFLRSRSRAVTLEDYAHLASEAAPEVARVRCVDANATGEAVRVLIVPSATDQDGVLRFEQLVPSPATVEGIARYLDDRRTIGARVVVEPPVYQGITVVARVKARNGTDPQRLKDDAVRALYSYFHPIHGGPDGSGWPFGRPVHAGEIYSVLNRLSGAEYVQDARLFPADPVTGQRSKAVDRIEIAQNALVFSYGHQVMVEGLEG